MNKRRIPKGMLVTTCLAIALSLLALDTVAQELDTKSLDALKWRNVGPFRGGRVTTVEGVPSKPGVF